MGKLLAQADKVIIISRVVYGGSSPFVKNVLDRSIWGQVIGNALSFQWYPRVKANGLKKQDLMSH